MQTPLRLLARFKRLRGTALDVFGYTAERRTERELIGWYEGIIKTILARLGAETPADLLELAKAPMDIRGYGPVKDAAIEKVKARVTGLLRPAALGGTHKAA
jgi:indolepyruvate ferredoxin oxidoreductase